MRSHIRSLYILIGIICLFTACSSDQQTPPYTLQEDTNKAVVFGEGIISMKDRNEFGGLFEPDGNTVYFGTWDPNRTPNHQLFVSVFKDGLWSKPEIPDFIDTPFGVSVFSISPDGKKLYGSYKIPSEDGTQTQSDIWMATKENSGWSKPELLGEPINSDEFDGHAALTTKENFYFTSRRPGGQGKTDIYRSRWLGDHYAEPENLGEPINSSADESDFYINPDESYLVFTRSGELFISYLKDGIWKAPEKLGPYINMGLNTDSPIVSPDGKYLFFTSFDESVQSDIYQIDFSLIGQE
jgi:hypothetical protein